MEEKVETKKKEKSSIFVKLGRQIKNGLDSIANAIANNPQVATAFITVFGQITIIGVNSVISTNKMKTTECMILDNSTNVRYHLKRPLNNYENIELSKRISEGQLKGEALNDMGLLK